MGNLHAGNFAVFAIPAFVSWLAYLAVLVVIARMRVVYSGEVCRSIRTRFPKTGRLLLVAGGLPGKTSEVC